MRCEETFVRNALVSYLGGSSIVSSDEGEDPPDFYLIIEGRRVAVEVTRLVQSTFDENGTLDNRLTQDMFGLKLVDKLNEELGPCLPENMYIDLSIEVPVSDPTLFTKKLFDLVKKIAACHPTIPKQKFIIAESRITILTIQERRDKKIVGYIINKNSSADILLNAEISISERIIVKNISCQKLFPIGPVWLAMLNDYMLADAHTYTRALGSLDLQHNFEKLFLISNEGVVTEFHNKRN